MYVDAEREKQRQQELCAEVACRSWMYFDHLGVRLWLCAAEKNLLIVHS